MDQNTRSIAAGLKKQPRHILPPATGQEPSPKKRRGRTAATAVVGQVQSLTRGLTLLERLAEAEGGVSLVDLAQRVGLAPSTTHRLLNTLEKMDYVHQAGDLGLWLVGVKAFTVGSAFLANRDLAGQSHPFLYRLMEQSGETTNLAVVDRGEAVVVAQVQCPEMMRMQVKLGSRAPLHASGVGKALLASMTKADVEDILHERGLPRITPSTIDTPEKLWVALREIAQRGYAYDDEEHAVGLRCVSSALYDEHAEPLGAISVAGPRSRISDERALELGALVANTAARLTHALGGRLPARVASATLTKS